MYTNIMPNSFVAVSDFHAIEWPLQKVKNHYLKEYDKNVEKHYKEYIKTNEIWNRLKNVV